MRWEARPLPSHSYGSEAVTLPFSNAFGERVPPRSRSEEFVISLPTVLRTAMPGETLRVCDAVVAGERVIRGPLSAGGYPSTAADKRELSEFQCTRMGSLRLRLRDVTWLKR
jgi:hypothetical protein